MPDKPFAPVLLLHLVGGDKLSFLKDSPLGSPLGTIQFCIGSSLVMRFVQRTLVFVARRSPGHPKHNNCLAVPDSSIQSRRKRDEWCSRRGIWVAESWAGLHTFLLRYGQGFGPLFEHFPMQTPLSGPRTMKAALRIAIGRCAPLQVTWALKVADGNTSRADQCFRDRLRAGSAFPKDGKQRNEASGSQAIASQKPQSQVMSTNWDGVQYNIHTAYHDGGILQFETAAAGVIATLGVDVDDVSQQWIVHPTGDQWAYSIENWEFGTYASLASDGRIVSATEPRTWYIVPLGDGVNGAICLDAICSSVWAPLSQVDPSQSDSNDVVLVAPSGAMYELWDMVAVGSATTRPTPSTSSASTSTSPSQSPTSISTALTASVSSTSSPLSITTTTMTETTTSVSLSTSTTTWSSSTQIGTYTQDDLPSSSRIYPPAATGQPVNTTPGSLQALKSCAPCGSSQCSFTPSGGPATSMYSVLIGQPVANCNSGSQESTTTKFGGTYELERSFSVEVTSGAGLGFLGPSISAATTIGSSNKTRIERAQEIEVTIRPGQIGALVANITYVTTPGTIRVDRSTLAFVSVEPENVLGYSVVYTSCDSQFQALTLPKVECARNSGRKATPVGFASRATLYISLLFFGIFIHSFSTL
ncbi:hypothetical protein NMY22_g1449 [Coprinellus aureogranulatus]|nr:hypothetical protein NMY22_g1449 [Coprinellus aureogranulatus]